jgi:HAD domain in Swiss Army Knife RNA repair proteins
MNIIFLDIDGVLNSELFFKQKEETGLITPHRNICPEKVGLLNELCKSVNAKVVISSSYRYSGMPYMPKLFAELGATFDIIGVTPSLHRSNNDGLVRGNEIRAWIEANEASLGCYRTDFHTYVILDDDNDMLLEQAKHLFLCDPYSGLTPTICGQIRGFFKDQNTLP